MDILLYTEKKYRKLRTGEVEYSPEISKASERWYIWRVALKVSKGERKNTRELHHLASKWKMDILDLCNTWAIKINVERSRREYLALKAQ